MKMQYIWFFACLLDDVVDCQKVRWRSCCFDYAPRYRRAIFVNPIVWWCWGWYEWRRSFLVSVNPRISVVVFDFNFIQQRFLSTAPCCVDMHLTTTQKKYKVRASMNKWVFCIYTFVGQVECNIQYPTTRKMTISSITAYHITNTKHYKHKHKRY